MAQRSIRLTELLFEEIVREAHDRGYASTSAFIRAAIKNKSAVAELKRLPETA